MEVHRQTCQSCGSTNLHNLLVRQQGEPTTVFVKCAECGDLVARYRLRAYYHHGKGMESYLRSVGADASDSARAQLSQFERVKEESMDGFRAAEEELHKSGRHFGKVDTPDEAGQESQNQ